MLRDGPGSSAASASSWVRCSSMRPRPSVELGELLASGQERRGRDRLRGSGQPSASAFRWTSREAKAEHVFRFGKARVERERLSKHGDALRGLAGPVAHEAQLVEHARRLVVDREVGLVARGRAIVAEQRSVDVAKELERTRGGGVELGGLRAGP